MEAKRSRVGKARVKVLWRRLDSRRLIGNVWRLTENWTWYRHGAVFMPSAIFVREIKTMFNKKTSKFWHIVDAQAVGENRMEFEIAWSGCEWCSRRRR